MATLSPSSRRRAGEGRLGRRRRPSPAAQGTAATGIRGKREREACGVDSPLDFREGACKEGGHGGGQRVVLAGAAAALQSLVTAGVRGRSTREPRGVDSPAHLG